MSSKPTAPADRRPNNEPYFIDKNCDCGGELVPDPEAYAKGWYDEFECMNCRTYYLDAPAHFIEPLKEAATEIKESFNHE